MTTSAASRLYKTLPVIALAPLLAAPRGCHFGADDVPLGSNPTTETAGSTGIGDSGSGGDVGSGGTQPATAGSGGGGGMQPATAGNGGSGGTQPTTGGSGSGGTQPAAGAGGSLQGGTGGYGGCTPVGCTEGTQPGDPNVCALAPSLPSTSTSCTDEGLGLSASGAITNPRRGSDLPLLSDSAAQPSTFTCFDDGSDAGLLPRLHCHRGGRVGVSVACGEMSPGMGGRLTFGGYALTEYAVYVEYGTMSYPTPGGGIAQTIYVGPSSLVLASDDDNNFNFTGSYTLTIDENSLALDPVCESSLSRYRAFPVNATFTATSTSLVIFDAERRVRLSYELLP